MAYTVWPDVCSQIGEINDTMAAIAGLEAVFGLLIKGLFIATFARKVTGN